MALRAGEDAFLLAFFLVTALWEPARPFYPGNWALALGVAGTAERSGELVWQAAGIGVIVSTILLLVWFFAGGKRRMRSRRENAEGPDSVAAADSQESHA